MGHSDDEYLAVSPRVRIVDEATAYGQDDRGRAAGARGTLRADPARRDPPLDAPLHDPAGARRAAAAAGHRGDRARHGHRRRRPAPGPEPARRGPQRPGGSLRRPRASLAAAALARASADQRHDPGRGRGGQARHRMGGAMRRRRRATSDSCARAWPGSRSWWSSRTCPATRPTSARRLAHTDILVDATARRDTSRPLLPNAWLGWLPAHAVVCDLAVDPYLLDDDPPVVRGIEGIPQGNLDQWEFGPDDPAWDRLPPGIPTGNRRTVVSCYSWPGVQPEACMELYGSQVTPLLKTLIWYGGLPRDRPGRLVPRAGALAGEPAPPPGGRAAGRVSPEPPSWNDPIDDSACVRGATGARRARPRR